MLKSAEALLREILQAVVPGPGCAIAISERTPLALGKPNWKSAAGVMDGPATKRYTQKIAELEKSNPIIDWSTVTEYDGARRRIARYYSEL